MELEIFSCKLTGTQKRKDSRAVRVVTRKVRLLFIFSFFFLRLTVRAWGKSFFKQSLIKLNFYGGFTLFSKQPFWLLAGNLKIQIDRSLLVKVTAVADIVHPFSSTRKREMSVNGENSGANFKNAPTMILVGW